MSSGLASLLCAFFISTLFLLDSKRKKNTTIALWIPFYCMIIAGSRMVSQWLYPEYVFSMEVSSEDYAEGSPLDRNIFIIIMILSAFILSRRRINWSYIFRYNSYVFLLIFYCAISMLWSDMPFVLLKRWIKGIGCVLAAIIVLTEPDPIEAIKTLIRRCTYLLIPLSILYIKYYREWGVTYEPFDGSPMFVGVTLHKNALGRLCMVCGFFLFYELLHMLKKGALRGFKKDLLINMILLMMTLWLLIKSNSATSQVGLVTGLVFFLLLGISFVRKNKNYAGYFFIVSIISCIIFYCTDISDIFLNLLGRDSTFTGRKDLWKELIGMCENPILGSGYESFFLGDRMQQLFDRHWWLPTQAHNGYLEIYLDLGIAGLFLWGGVLYNYYKYSIRTIRYNFDFGRVQMTFLFIALIYNITEAAFQLTTFLWFFLLTLLLDCNTVKQGR